MTTGQKIKEFRESLGYTVDEFAKLLGIHRSSVYRYEETNFKEKRDIPLSVAVMICEKFNLSLDWLAGLSDTMYRNKENKQSEIGELYESLSQGGKNEVITFTTYIKTKENQHGG
jgi:DNA-binding XRE family transcriptional regulator